MALRDFFSRGVEQIDGTNELEKPSSDDQTIDPFAVYRDDAYVPAVDRVTVTELTAAQVDRRAGNLSDAQREGVAVEAALAAARRANRDAPASGTTVPVGTSPDAAAQFHQAAALAQAEHERAKLRSLLSRMQEASR
jgi:hypothetical protein